MRFLPLSLGLFLSACAGAPRAYVDEGRQAAERGEHEKAVALYSRAIDSDPDVAEAWYARGYSHVRLRQDANAPGEGRAYEERAIADFTRAIQLNPSHGDAYYNLAMVFLSRAMYRQAAEQLLNAIRFLPQDPEPHLDLARIYEQKFEDMQPQAYEHYEKYADLGGRDREAREKAREQKERRKQSAPPTGKAPTEEDEKKAQELHDRAMLLLKEDKRAEAVKLVEELLSVYGRTRFVQEPKRLIGLKAVLDAFKPKPKPEPPK
ncbi:MAG TPA: tetratricopeptide repeat protein [Planctomycetota bacterium]|nr:tetratricopeptide repeat protein [Planctomycetota bacterium]